jgi:hypothetical protein
VSVFESKQPPADAWVVEGECLAKIKASSTTQLHKSQRELTALIDNADVTGLSADGLGMAVAIREAINVELDGRFAR